MVGQECDGMWLHDAAQVSVAIMAASCQNMRTILTTEEAWLTQTSGGWSAVIR